MDDSADAYYGLAPLDLPNHRARRYQGDDLCLHVGALTDADQERLFFIYDYLLELLKAVSPQSEEESPEVVRRLSQHLQRRPCDDLVDVAREFGRASHAREPGALLAKVIHDIRGGGLTPLLGQLLFAKLERVDQVAVHALYFLTRDHLKIMRNALLGLDDERRNLDLQPKYHGTGLIRQKWHQARLHILGRDITVHVDCPQEMEVCESCVEFGAVDRILYNLIGNACRHSADDLLRLILLPVPTLEGENIRFVLTNRVSEQDLEHLRSLDLTNLFTERVSTTGSGYGLSIAADFVTNAYGLTSNAEALERGYLGATLRGDHTFAAWFHWPRVCEEAASAGHS